MFRNLILRGNAWNFKDNLSGVAWENRADGICGATIQSNRNKAGRQQLRRAALLWFQISKKGQNQHT
jgi:hypothetical protein